MNHSGLAMVPYSKNDKRLDTYFYAFSNPNFCGGDSCKGVKLLYLDGPGHITPELVELMKEYDGLVIAYQCFNECLDCIPPNIKYIDLSICCYFDKDLANLPAGLIGLALSESYPASKLHNLPHGLKVLYQPEILTFGRYLRPANVDMLMEVLPPSVEYISYRNKIHVVDMASNGKRIKEIIPNDKHMIPSHVIFDF